MSFEGEFGWISKGFATIIGNTNKRIELKLNISKEISYKNVDNKAKLLCYMECLHVYITYFVTQRLMENIYVSV